MNSLVTKTVSEILDYISEATKYNYNKYTVETDLQKILTYFYDDVKNETISNLEEKKGEK